MKIFLLMMIIIRCILSKLVKQEIFYILGNKNIILICIPNKNYLELIEMIASKYELKYNSVSP